MKFSIKLTFDFERNKNKVRLSNGEEIEIVELVSDTEIADEPDDEEQLKQYIGFRPNEGG